MSKHTPTPWLADLLPAVITDARRFIIATTACADLSEAVESASQQRANCAFIVRACNAHEDLLEACKAVLCLADMLQPRYQKDAAGYLSQVRKAIAKAEGRDQ